LTVMTPSSSCCSISCSSMNPMVRESLRRIGCSLSLDPLSRILPLHPLSVLGEVPGPCRYRLGRTSL
jgi:hypothetical protein